MTAAVVFVGVHYTETIRFGLRPFSCCCSTNKGKMPQQKPFLIRGCYAQTINAIHTADVRVVAEFRPVEAENVLLLAPTWR